MRPMTHVAIDVRVGEAFHLAERDGEYTELTASTLRSSRAGGDENSIGVTKMCPPIAPALSRCAGPASSMGSAICSYHDADHMDTSVSAGLEFNGERRQAKTPAIK